MKNTSRDHFPVLCCHRASFSHPISIPAAVGCPDAGASFLQRSTWTEFRAVLAGLRDQCPTAMPVVVRTAWLPDTILGQCIRRRQRFVVRLNEGMSEPQAVDTLCHEWAHALAWNYSLDRLAKTPGLDPVEFERACHDEAWGCAYSRVWRAYLEVGRAEA
jgi:hypothetical protein